MKVLVTAASRHGSTAEIAEAVTDVLQTAGIDAAFLNVEDVISLAGYDAVVLGSGVYMGRWLREARDFVLRNEQELATRPIWLFSSGPLGSDIDKPAMNDELMDELVRATDAREHRTIARLAVCRPKQTQRSERS